VTNHASSSQALNGHSDVVVLIDSNNETNQSNSNEGGNEEDDDDDDDLFCDSLGPELMEKQVLYNNIHFQI
jgi:hypothetical protein